MKTRWPHLILLLVAATALALIACTADSGEAAPCTTLEGSEQDPCAGDISEISATRGSGGGPGGPEGGPTPIRWFLDGGYGGQLLEGHIVVRGMYQPSTVRCVDQKTVRVHPYTSLRDLEVPAGIGILKCYADIQVNAYIVGSGPSTLTALAIMVHYWDRAATAQQIENLRADGERVLLQGGYHLYIRAAPDRGVTGVESVFFLGPELDASVESWQVFRTWDLERREDDTVIVVHPYRDYWIWKDADTYRSQVEWTLSDFTTAAQTAHTSRLADYDGRIDADEGTPQLVTSANSLHSFHVETGNVNHPDGPPETSLPPACGLAVPDQTNNPGLMQDCETLLGLKDTLRGTGSLNWSVDEAIGDWDGTTTGGTPSRVTKLELDDEDLTGTIPAGLGSLTGLTHLDLSDNSLTGDIPAELGLLHNVVSVKLSGNSLTGCIPLSLQDVPTNDLDDLGLPDCVE